MLLLCVLQLESVGLHSRFVRSVGGDGRGSVLAICDVDDGMDDDTDDGIDDVDDGVEDIDDAADVGELMTVVPMMTLTTLVID